MGVDDVSAMQAAACFFLDATPLLDTNWTGIPAVCANMARAMLAAGCDLRFCIGRDVLPTAAVADALSRNTGLIVEHEYRTGMLRPEPLVWPAGRVGVGLSASVKRLRRVFAVECSVVHDLSTLLQPHYHTPENIVWHADRILEDIASNDVTLCVSQATMEDLVSYLGVPPDRLVLAPNGIEWPSWFRIRADGDLADGAEPYVVVLGTQEPRKNASLVFELLGAQPALLSRYRWVFIGRPGWHLDQIGLPETLQWAVAAGRIVQTGFVTEYEKYLLLRGATVSVFPSLFEGFGLPVLESLSVGTPCIASLSSSIPEVGGPHCFYFDPCSVSSLGEALRAVLDRNPKGSPEYQAGCADWTARFQWSSTVRTMLAALSPAIAAAATTART